MTPGDLEDWVRAAQSDIPPKIKHCALSYEEISQLIDYYRAKRLDVQLRFFDKRAGDNRRYDRLLRKLPPVLFFLSVGAVFAHFLVDIASGRHEYHSLSVVLIAFAAALPVLGGGIRNFGGVHEFVRNANLFTQAGETLRQQRAELDKLSDDPSRCTPDCTHAESVLRAMWRCEQRMEDEHREWMRLMLETEWYS